MTNKEYINQQIVVGIHLHRFLPLCFIILGFVGFAVTDKEYFSWIILSGFFIVPSMTSWNLKKTLKCPNCKAHFIGSLESKMIHWNKNTFEWNCCPSCGLNLNEEVNPENT